MKKNLYLTAKDCSQLRMWNKTTSSWIGGVYFPKAMRHLCKLVADYQLWTNEKVAICGKPKHSDRFIIIKEF